MRPIPSALPLSLPSVAVLSSSKARWILSEIFVEFTLLYSQLTELVLTASKLKSANEVSEIKQQDTT